MIEFFDRDGVVGQVRVEDDELVASDPSLERLTEGFDAAEFEMFYDGWSNGYLSGQKVLDVSEIVAAAEVHTGAMIALVPTEEDAERLAVDGGEDADELHVTLAYLGEAALIPEEVQDNLVECVARCVADRVSIVARAFSVALFNPDTGVTASTVGPLDELDDLVAGAGGPDPCVVLLMSGQQLPGFHEYLLRDVAATFAQAGMKLHPQHEPWVPHLTLAYTGDADLAYFTDRVGPVTFDRVRLAFGDEVYDIPLGEAVITAAFDPNQPRDDDGRWSRTAVNSSDVDDFTRRFKKAKSGRGAFRSVQSVADLAKGDAQLARAAQSYTHTYKTLNARLRNGTPLDESDSRVSEDLRKMFRGARTERDIVVNRGVADIYKLLGPGAWGTNMVGLEWRDDGFVSTTTSEKVARHFAATAGGYEQALLNIFVPAGSQAIDMRGPEFNEQEILLAPGYRYRVMGVKSIENSKRDAGDPRWVINVEVIPNDTAVVSSAADLELDDDNDDDDERDFSPSPNSDSRRFIDDGPAVKIVRRPRQSEEER